MTTEIKAVCIADGLVSNQARVSLLLGEGTATVGRGPGCDLEIEGCGESVSRSHAVFTWRGDRFEVEDLGSLNGTTVDGLALQQGQRCPVPQAATLKFGSCSFRLYYLGEQPAAGIPGAVLSHFSSMASLDIVKVIGGAMEVFRLVARVEEAYLISTTRHWPWGDEFLAEGATSIAMIDANPLLRVSRQSIEECLSGGRKVVKFLSGQDETDRSRSILELQLRRIWIRPLRGFNGEVVAAVYLQSRGAGDPFDSHTEALLDAVSGQLEVAIHNAALHKQVTDANLNLEDKVRERTHQLEESHGRLVAQDRLATLGRLVAGIAHELNNPAGAIASLAETQGRLLQGVLSLREGLMLAAGGEAAAVGAFLDWVIEAAGRVAPDSRTRRAREEELGAGLRAAGVPTPDRWARLMAKLDGTGVESDRDAPLMKTMGLPLCEGAENLYTFVRANGTIAGAAAGIARIVTGLKQYAHLDQAELMVEDVHKSLQLTLDVLKSRIGQRVVVTTRFAPLEPFPHRPGELSQVWTNLVDNALRAMGESGELTLETRDRGDSIEILVTDTGPGIPEGIQPRIFDLDFTTRGPGAGLGLGLPICRTIVEKNHGGSISFTSRPGCTVFTVVLPKHPPGVPDAQL